ncbi:DUF6894 family protein [Methylobacterium nigriterrae]|uniref:DUF6894 family protein n=1 Tax=Methylobacterium nigriterrae TaxID=3127512 RepID=UPI0030140471
MPWFYFDVQYGGDDVTRDHRGIDIPDLEAAKVEALAIWTRILFERGQRQTHPREWNVVIRDVHGTELARVPYPGEPDDTRTG